MYRQSAPSLSMKKKSTTPACKHCENLRLPSSHWLRSLAGQIVCPVLLATECRYCHLTGHTVKACPELELKNKKMNGQINRVKIEPKTEFVPVKSGVHVLQEDTDSEEEGGRVFPEEISRESVWNGKTSFAKVVATPPPVKLSLIHPDESDSYYPKSPADSPPVHSLPIMPYDMLLNKYKGMDWADICDSDDEEFLIN